MIMPVSPHIHGFFLLYQIMQQKNLVQNPKVGTKMQARVHDPKAQKVEVKVHYSSQ